MRGIFEGSHRLWKSHKHLSWDSRKSARRIGYSFISPTAAFSLNWPIRSNHLLTCSQHGRTSRNTSLCHRQSLYENNFLFSRSRVSFQFHRRPLMSSMNNDIFLKTEASINRVHGSIITTTLLGFYPDLKACHILVLWAHDHSFPIPPNAFECHLNLVWPVIDFTELPP